MNTLYESILGFQRQSKLVSLWDMMSFKAGNFVALGTLLTTFHGAAEDASKQASKGEFATEAQRKTVRYVAESVLKLAEPIGLKVTVNLARAFLLNLEDADISHELIASRLHELERAIRFEMSAELFLHMASDKVRYYEPKEPPFGDSVENAFPASTDDIMEAGKCLATDRATACVFHLMRVMEVGLAELAKALGIPDARNWGEYLRNIDARIKTVPPGDVLFFRDAAAHLSTVKVAWRNPTMHIVRQYSLESAEEIYASVRVFMRHLATKLGNKGSSS